MKLAGGKFTVVDGPFTESKELVASYALFQVKTMEEAVHWTKRFLEVLGKGECELRPIFETEDFSEKVFTPEERKREEATRASIEAQRRTKLGRALARHANAVHAFARASCSPRFEQRLRPSHLRRTRANAGTWKWRR